MPLFHTNALTAVIALRRNLWNIIYIPRIFFLPFSCLIPPLAIRQLYFPLIVGGLWEREHHSHDAETGFHTALLTKSEPLREATNVSIYHWGPTQWPRLCPIVWACDWAYDWGPTQMTKTMSHSMDLWLSLWLRTNPMTKTMSHSMDLWLSLWLRTNPMTKTMSHSMCLWMKISDWRHLLLQLMAVSVPVCLTTAPYWITNNMNDQD